MWIKVYDHMGQIPVFIDTDRISVCMAETNISLLDEYMKNGIKPAVILLVAGERIILRLDKKDILRITDIITMNMEI